MTLEVLLSLTNKSNMNIDLKMLNKRHNKEDFKYPIRDMMNGSYKIRKYGGPSRGWMWMRLYVKHCTKCSTPLFVHNLPGKCNCPNIKCRETDSGWFMDTSTSNYGYMIKYICKEAKTGKYKGNLHRMKISQHRWIMKQHLGRKLTREEQVHHIDMNKTNNDISNLWLCSRSQHGIAHYSFNRICEELMGNFHKYADIKFNLEIGKYYLTEKETHATR